MYKVVYCPVSKKTLVKGFLIFGENYNEKLVPLSLQMRVAERIVRWTESTVHSVVPAFYNKRSRKYSI
jgi:hypothetical protein